MRRLVVTLAALFLMPHFACAEKIGNGGGAWVCREADNTIRWAQLVDLFEAADEFGLTLAEYPGSPKEVVEQVQTRLSHANAEFSHSLVPYFNQLNNLEPHPPEVTYTDNVVQTIDDSLYRLKPSPKRCANGILAYEQVVNYKEDGLILVSSEIFKSLSSNAKAALIVHEAIYAFRRETVGDSTSVMTRKMVGMIFSTLSDAELKKRFELLGMRENGF